MMKAVGLALVLGVLAAFSPAMAEIAPTPSPAGLWRTISDVDGQPRALVRLEEAGGELRGVVVDTLRPGEPRDRVCDRCSGARRNQRIAGMTILWGLRRDPRDPRRFINGSVLDPDTGAVYSAQIRLSPDGQSLVLRGYLMVTAAGRSQTWLRAPAR